MCASSAAPDEKKEKKKKEEEGKNKKKLNKIIKDDDGSDNSVCLSVCHWVAQTVAAAAHSDCLRCPPPSIDYCF